MYSWIYSSSPSDHFTIGLNENITCSHFSSNDNHLAVTAVRRLGPEDTTKPAIVFYSGSGVTDYVINERLADANISIPLNTFSHAIITYGSSDWTLFERENFEGRAVCLETPGVVRLSKLYEPHLNILTVRSLIKGCNFSREYIEELRRNYK